MWLTLAAGDVTHQYSYSGGGSAHSLCVPVKKTIMSIPGPNGEQVEIHSL